MRSQFITSTLEPCVIVLDNRGDLVASCPADRFNPEQVEFFPPFNQQAPSRLAALIELRRHFGLEEENGSETKASTPG